MAHIARLCGVSKMTVSRAIRNDPSVSEATRQRVLRVAERENYLPSAYGAGKSRTLATQRNYYVLFQKQAALQDAFFGEVIRAIQQELFSIGRSCSLGIVEDHYAEFMRLYDMLQTANVAGVLVVGPVAREPIDVLLERFGNVILVDNPGDPDLPRPCSAVFCENSYGAQLAVKHLLGLGRKRILLMCGPEDNYFSRSLVEGYNRVFRENGLVPDPRMVLRADFHMNGGYEAANAAMESGLAFDAVFTNDEMACGVLKAIRDRGLRVPNDVAVVGFDNLALGQAVSPSLTTVAVDRQRMGQKAVELLVRLEQERDVDDLSERVGLFPKLIIRESCGWRDQHHDD